MALFYGTEAFTYMYGIEVGQQNGFSGYRLTMVIYLQ